MKKIYLLLLVIVIFSFNIMKVKTLSTSSNDYVFTFDKNFVNVGNDLRFNIYGTNSYINLEIMKNDDIYVKSFSDNILYYSSTKYNDCKIYKVQNGLEYETVFKTIPLEFNYTISIEINDLKYYKQLPLNIQHNPKDFDFINETYAKSGDFQIIRNINIINSYAVYSNDKKVIHIYRPELKNNLGETVYIDMTIEDNKLIFILDKDFMSDIKTYPISLLPVFGYTEIGETGLNIGVQGVVSMCKFTTPYIDGNSIIHITNITHRTWYGNNGYYSLGMIYSKDEVLEQPSLYLDVSSNTRELLSYNWLVFNMDYNVTESTEIYIGIYGQANYWSLGDSGEIDQTHLFYQSPSNYPTPYNYADRTGRTTPDYIMSTYATYEVISLEEEEPEEDYDSIMTLVYMIVVLFISIIFTVIYAKR